jgi:hypothetical protein
VQGQRHRLNVFIVFGVQQVLAVRGILADQGEVDGLENLCLFYIDSDLAHTLPHCRVEHCRRQGVLAYVAELRRFREQVKAWLADYRQVCVFMPHAYYYPANYLLFADIDVQRYLIPDGVINYCDYRVGVAKTPTMLLRWLFGHLLGLPYWLYSGHITAIEAQRYDGVYTFSRSNLLTDHDNLVDIPVPRGEPYKPDTRVCLFLDHYLQDVPAELQSRIISSARQYLDDCPAEIVYHKKHPSWNVEENAILACEKCVELDSDEPAELLIEHLHPTEVISYASSALSTIREIYPELKCTAIGLNLLQDLPDYADVQALFASRGVSLVDAS